MFSRLSMWANIVILMLTILLLPVARCDTDGNSMQISNGKVSIRSVSNIGFDLFSGKKTAATVRFGSNGLITADKHNLSHDGRSLIFSRLTGKPGSGLAFGDKDSITVSLAPNDSYPEISFDLTVKSFNPEKWQNVAGKQPFHFLAIYMPDAKVWHQHGWLNETPVADPFPLLQDVHVGTPEISAYKYNRNWSYTIPLGGHPTPVIGLWAPDKKHYAGFEFESTRLNDNSEKDIATGYCWGDGEAEVRKPNPDQFVSLVYPHGGRGFQELVFPAVGSHLRSHGKLLWSLELPATNDPNRFFYSYVWDRYRNRLPAVPSIVDFSWLPGDARMNDFNGPGSGGQLIVKFNGIDAAFVEPDTKLTLGWTAYNESIVALAKSQNNKAILSKVENEAIEYLKYAKYFTIYGDECVFWEKPLEGKFVQTWGGAPVTTIHNAENFITGRLFLDLYKYLDRKDYLDVVDKVFNTAKHIGWTRNELVDIPSSPSGIGSMPCQSFLLDYYMTFKNSPDKVRRDRAKQALDLARSFAYRYMSVWLSDSNRMDNLSPAFQWEVTSGRDWAAASCSADMMIDMQAMTAVHTGDPVLMRIVNGSLSKFNDLYQDTYRDSITDYKKGDFTEAYGFYNGSTSGAGNRVPYGGMFQIAMLQPVGTSIARVLAGEKAAMVFNKDGMHTKIRAYRYTPEGNLSFIVDSKRSGFDLSLTTPYVDINDKPVYLVRNGKKSLLNPGVDYIRPSQASWSLMIKGLNDGDKIIVGSPDENSPVLPSKPANPVNRHGGKYSGFDIIKLPFDTIPDTNWNNLDSWAGVPSGELWSYGIPFNLAESFNKSMLVGKSQLSKSVADADTIFLLYSDGDGPAPSLIFDDGSKKSVDSTHESLAWRAWPPIYTSRLLVSSIETNGKTVVGIDPGSCVVAAMTITRSNNGTSVEECKNALAEGSKEWRKIKVQEDKVAKLRKNASKVADGVVAILPPSPLGPSYDFLQRAGLTSRSVALTPEQLVEPGFFTPERFPVAFYASNGYYTHTVKTPGDGADAIVKYVKDGGTLIMCPPSAAFPMYLANGPGFTRGEPLVDRLGIPIGFVFEDKHPEKVFFKANPDQSVLNDVPAEYPWPYGDTRLRVIAKDEIPEGSVYTSIYSVVGESGKNYGDSAGMVDLPGNGGRILFIYGLMTAEQENGSSVASAAIQFLIDSALKNK
ncbi:MAG: hypothetical protein ACYC27_08130 [Armatimonadota bacterium]